MESPDGRWSIKSPDKRWKARMPEIRVKCNDPAASQSPDVTRAAYLATCV
jgi:hypothetical protein